jgi:DNA adenine methylase
MRSNVAYNEPARKIEEDIKPFRTQLLKWIGNKQRQAEYIIGHFPKRFGTYYEPFLGSSGVLGVLSPLKAVGSDSFEPLIEIWQTLKEDSDLLKSHYADRYALIGKHGKKDAYDRVRKNYNESPNGGDLLFLCRACYGGVVRFRKKDGYMSTPVGAHDPVSPQSFSNRVDAWKERIAGTKFVCADFERQMAAAKKGDLIYCDPPYTDTQTILYGAQGFSLGRLIDAIQDCKSRGVYVALSIDGTKFSGKKICGVRLPEGLFEQEISVNVGRSMLKRFQMDGQTLEEHHVTDRLLLTYCANSGSSHRT